MSFSVIHNCHIAGTSSPSLSFNRYFLNQNSHPPTESIDYDFVPFGKLFAIGYRIPDFAGILNFTYRVDVLNDQAGFTQHRLFPVPGFHLHGLKDSIVDKKTNPADYQINRQGAVKRQYPENRQRKKRYEKYQMTHGNYPILTGAEAPV